jgi:hypothetical protein
LTILVQVLADAAERRERETREKAERQKVAKEEAEQMADKKKKKPIRYPTEDLDVRLSDKEKKAGMKAMRPVPSRCVPFQDDQGTFESFLLAWNFLVVYGWVGRKVDALLMLMEPLANPSICRHLHWTSSNMPYNIRLWTRLVHYWLRFIPRSFTI